MMIYPGDLWVSLFFDTFVIVGRAILPDANGHDNSITQNAQGSDSGRRVRYQNKRGEPSAPKAHD